MISTEGNFSLLFNKEVIQSLIVCINTFTHIFLIRTRERIIIVMVLRIPMTVDIPMIERLAVSADVLNIIQDVHLGLQTPSLRKKSSLHTMLEFVLSF